MLVLSYQIKGKIKVKRNQSKKSKKLKKIQDKKSTPKKFKVNPIKKSMLTLSLLAILGVSIEMGDKK
ncbi:TPA: hypothetical protein LLB66_001698 [Enterococcus faecium]|nr:hypothetical protein [Enterococcus faecium]